MTDLARHFQSVRIVDTHEHMRGEQQWLNDGPRDVLADLFANYVPGDLVSAGMAGPLDHDKPIDERWAALEPHWQHIQHTGYGEAVRDIAKACYDIDQLTLDAMIAAQPRLDNLRQPGERYRILHDLAGLDHIQTDNFCAPCPPDASGVDFFLYDLSMARFARGFSDKSFDPQPFHDDVGITINNLATLRQTIEALFAKHGPHAIAVKSQHAYRRTLHWEPRADADAERALLAYLADPDAPSQAERLCIEDWCIARACELAAEYNLPLKIHCGYYAGNATMVTDRINAGRLCPLLIAYPDTRFVLMHIAYPYSEELIAVVKHFANAYADLCWAWSINPHASAAFVRSFIHAAPINKLFAFGGDTIWPTSAYGYCIQARRWLTRALQAEINDGALTEREAITIVDRICRENQYDCFDVLTTRNNLHATN